MTSSQPPIAPALIEFELHAAAAAGDQAAVLHVLQKQRAEELRLERRFGKAKAVEGQPEPSRRVVELNVLNAAGRAPLHYAASRGHKNVVKLLVEQGAIIDLPDREGETALLIAAFQGHEGVVRVLLDMRANLQYRDPDGWTALHNAASNGHLAAARLLIGRGIGVNAKSLHEQTPLMLAAGRGHTAMIHVLIENGADLYLRNEHDETAYDQAAVAEFVETCDVLVELAEQQDRIRELASTTYIDIIYENQQAGLLTGFSALSALPWSDPSGKAAHKEDAALPDSSWFWLNDWRIDRHGAMDEQGWMYARDWRSTTWAEAPSFMMFARRRRWLRVCKRKVSPGHQKPVVLPPRDETLSQDDYIGVFDTRLVEAMRVEESGNHTKALDLYEAAISGLIAGLKNETEKMKRQIVKRKADEAFERAERLSRIIKERKKTNASVIEPVTHNDESMDEVAEAIPTVATETVEGSLLVATETVEGSLPVATEAIIDASQTLHEQLPTAAMGTCATDMAESPRSIIDLTCSQDEVDDDNDVEEATPEPLDCTELIFDRMALPLEPSPSSSALTNALVSESISESPAPTARSISPIRVPIINSRLVLDAPLPSPAEIPSDASLSLSKPIVIPATRSDEGVVRLRSNSVAGPMVQATRSPPAPQASSISTDRPRMQASVAAAALAGYSARELRHQLRRPWVANSAVTECTKCRQVFSLRLRRHHCRYCGNIFCDNCSTNEWPLDGRLRRVCDTCYSLLQDEHGQLPTGDVSLLSRSLTPETIMAAITPNDDVAEQEDTQLTECPKCSQTFRGLPSDEIEAHMSTCFSSDMISNSPMAMGGRYLVHRAAAEAVGTEKECPICFEEFVARQEIATLTCLCQYHRSCIDQWYSRAGTKGCPVHST